MKTLIKENIKKNPWMTILIILTALSNIVNYAATKLDIEALNLGWLPGLAALITFIAFVYKTYLLPYFTSDDMISFGGYTSRNVFNKTSDGTVTKYTLESWRVSK